MADFIVDEEEVDENGAPLRCIPNFLAFLYFSRYILLAYCYLFITSSFFPY